MYYPNPNYAENIALNAKYRIEQAEELERVAKKTPEQKWVEKIEREAKIERQIEEEKALNYAKRKKRWWQF